MKIGIMGAHGTGKTTFAETLKGIFQRHYEPVVVVTGIARSCPFGINQEVSEEAQRWIYHRHMLTEIEAEARAELVVCDRTAVDSLVYAQVGGLDRVVDNYLPAALDWMRTYEQLFWFRPVSGWLVSDGIRDVDPAFQSVVDRVFEEWINAYSIPALEIRGKQEKGGGDDGRKKE